MFPLNKDTDFFEAQEAHLGEIADVVGRIRASLNGSRAEMRKFALAPDGGELSAPVRRALAKVLASQVDVLDEIGKVIAVADAIIEGIAAIKANRGTFERARIDAERMLGANTGIITYH